MKGILREVSFAATPSIVDMLGSQPITTSVCYYNLSYRGIGPLFDRHVDAGWTARLLNATSSIELDYPISSDAGAIGPFHPGYLGLKKNVREI